MSADNWAMCPRCKDARRAKAADMHAKASAAYGTESVEEFDRLRAKASELDAEVNSNVVGCTFREDYEVYGAEDGEVTVSYRGGCNKCGLSLSFEHSHSLGATDG